MPLHFPYKPTPVKRPVVPLHGRMVRPRPIAAVTIIGPVGTATRDAILDTGSDDTVFSEDLAVRIGLDRTTAPTGMASGVGMQGHLLRYARVTLRIADPHEQREWSAIVGFTAAKLRQPLVGFASCLQYFTATFHGDRESLELAINGLYPGT